MSDSTDDRSSQTDTESHDDSRAAESDDDVSTAPAYCTAQDVAYAETSFFGSYRAVLRHLHGLGAPRRGAARHLTPSAGQA